jgi:hypothetical protein
MGKFEMYMALAWFALLSAIPVAIWIAIDHFFAVLAAGH